MSLLMVRKSFPAHAADKTEKIAQDSAIVAMWQVLGDAEAYLREGKKNHNVKNVLAAAIKAAEKENPNDRSIAEAKKVLAQFDAAADAHIDDISYKYKVGDKIKTPDGVGTVQKKTHTNSGKPAYEVKLDKGGIVVYVEQSVSAADADKSEELEREIKGDVVAVVSGNAARVSKDVSFATAKEGVESFARKNGVSVVASQEYGEAYKFKFSAAIDSAAGAAQDAGAFPLAEKASRIVKGIMSQVKRVEDEAEEAFRNAKTAEEKNAAQRDAVAIHNIMDKLEIAASYA